MRIRETHRKAAYLERNYDGSFQVNFLQPSLGGDLRKQPIVTMLILLGTHDQYRAVGMPYNFLGVGSDKVCAHRWTMRSNNNEISPQASASARTSWYTTPVRVVCEKRPAGTLAFSAISWSCEPAAFSSSALMCGGRNTRKLCGISGKTEIILTAPSVNAANCAARKTANSATDVSEVSIGTRIFLNICVPLFAST